MSEKHHELTLIWSYPKDKMIHTADNSQPSRRTGRPFTVLIENAVSAYHALTQNWVRSLLTMSGITVGMIAIVSLIAILKGVKAEVGNQVKGLGANLVLIVPGKLDENGLPSPYSMIGISSLTNEDVIALQTVKGVDRVSPISIVSGTIEYGKKEISALALGTNKMGVVMNPTPLAEGRYFEANEEDGQYCVLGAKQRKELFGDTPALGKKIKVRGLDWTIVGVLSKPAGDGTMGNAMLGLSDVCYLTGGAVRKKVEGARVDRIALQTGFKDSADAMIGSIEGKMRQMHDGKENFGVITQKKGLAIVIKMLDLAEKLLGLVAGISLFVAGVGIMNIMLVTVRERTREIGIRKTVGARRSDIFAQFIVEAVILSLVGGAVGLVFSAALCSVIGHVSILEPILDGSVVLAGMTTCTVVGVLFGVAPAIRAARLDPIDAMRHE
ncbi:MAG: ABC transporter permease [Chthonomonadaceae bacterium]|nr:ABC transporter permease [Chthonomonadaceae bacterium]